MAPTAGLKKNLGARKSTVFKKAKELSTLCGVDVLLICYDSDKPNIPQVWCSQPSDCINGIINHFNDVNNKTKMNSTSLGEKEGKNINDVVLGVDALKELSGNLAAKIDSVTARINSIKKKVEEEEEEGKSNQSEITAANNYSCEQSNNYCNNLDESCLDYVGEEEDQVVSSSEDQNQEMITNNYAETLKVDDDLHFDAFYSAASETHHQIGVLAGKSSDQGVAEFSMEEVDDWYNSLGHESETLKLDDQLDFDMINNDSRQTQQFGVLPAKSSDHQVVEDFCGMEDDVDDWLNFDVDVADSEGLLASMLHDDDVNFDDYFNLEELGFPGVDFHH